MERTETFAGDTGGTGDDIQPPATVGRYALRGRIGRGGFADVYRAWDERLERWLAVKVPRHERRNDREAVAAWLTEARAMARVDHPHVIPIFDVGSEGDDLSYIVCKLVEGADLKRLLLDRRFEWQEAVRLCATVADALSHIHEKGLVHRDVKPGNILVAGDGHVWLTDFGLALWEDRIGDQALAYAGTLGYMSPEQARGEGHLVDGRTDVFSLGVVLYRMLTGHLPFSGQTDSQLRANLASRDATPLRQWNPQVPLALERICLKALSKRASDRYSAASEFRDELLALLAEGNEPSASVEPRTVAVEREPNAPVRPRGLRAYQESDREFFLRLIEGPRDRHGTPQAIRDWIAAVTDDAPEPCFPVGVAYGPSGSGKTSLFRAGIVPLLPTRIVTLFADASTERLSATLVRRLRHQFPGESLPDDLAGALRTLRLRVGGQSGTKLLIVLDQFEQRLHGGEAERSALIEALRQCDGVNVQAILIVRDDFWMPLTRFLHELDIRLVEGTNAFAVDLFSTRHAQRVLEELGRAYGSLPAIPAPLNAGQRRCLEEIVATVQERDRVVPIRLAIVAQMLREKPWNEGAIGRIGGAEGVVGAFLERAFESPNSPPARRRLAPAARKVLAELLPSDDVAIKDRAKSEATLRDRAGLSNQDFEELLRTLDKELRVLTLAGDETEESRASVPIDSERRYRLTHDYLIRPLRNWLNRKRRETFRGRTRLRLEELAALWASHPEARFLPTAWEFAAIELLVPDVERTQQERRLLETTRTRLRGVAFRWGFLIAALCVIGFISYRIYGERRSSAEMRGLVERLATAQVENVPSLFEELDRRGERSLAALAVVADDAAQPNPVRVRAAAALLPFDAKYGETVARALADAESTAEFAMLRERWRRAEGQAAQTLTVLSRSPELPPQSRLRASAAILANPPPGRLDWSEAAPEVARALVDAPAHELPFWIETFRPLKGTLRPEVSKLFSEERAREVRLNAAAALAAWGDDDIQSVVRAVLEADASSFRVLLPALARRRDEALPALLERTLAPAPAETQPSVRLTDPLDKELKDARGLASDEFAFCQSLPRERFADVASQLEALGYRPVVVRPWTSGEEPRIAAIWKREAGEWRLRESITREEAIAEDSQARAAGLVAYDLAAEESGEGARWTALWGTPPEGVSSSAMYVDVSEADHSQHWGPLNDIESVPRTNVRTVADGGARYSSIRWQVDGIVAYVDRWTASDEEIASNGHAGWPLVDVRAYGGSDSQYGAIWWDGVAVDWKLISAADLNEHRKLCSAAAEAGYVPVSLSVSEGPPMRATSVWHKRLPAPDELDEQAARRANAAIAAIELGAFADVRSSLIAGEDNRVRTEIVARLADFGVDPERILGLLELERDPSVLAALLLAAAGYEPESLSTAVQEATTSLAVEYAAHPSAGVRSAALCLLRRWERESELTVAVESAPRSPEDRSDFEWYRGPEEFDFVVVPGPSVFSMGSRGDDPDRSASMETIHVRSVPHAFAIATTEVTVAQYRRFDPTYRAPSAYATDESCPATMISLFDAMAYCRWLSEQAGVSESEMCYPSRDGIAPGMTLTGDLLERTGYRLPTEAEWEFACRAGSRTSRHYGSRASLLPLYGWDADNSDYRTHPVGRLLPNDLGLFDMYGNAMERTHSPWAPYPRSISETVVDRIEASAIGSSDVFAVRGGAVLYAPSNGRSAQRHRNAAATRSPDLGFRIVRTVSALRP